MEPADAASISSAVLVIDRDPAFRRTAMRAAEAAGFTARAVIEAETDAPDPLPESCVMAVVEVGADRDDAVGLVARLARAVPVIAASSGASLSLAVAAMRAGARDFVVKPARPETIADSMRRAGTPAPAASSGDPSGFAGILGGSSVMRDVRDQLERIAPSRAPVLITGESGTGKELCAEAIHARSGRTGAFVPINCGAIPRDLMESELFGHVRGAFTGAGQDRQGAAELAAGGTLFLDEIGEMEPGLQTKLLRFVQTGTIARVGDSRPRPVDVRIVCATNRDPASDVAAGRFREDLYYRLNVLPLHLPALRERPGDAVPLAEAFLARYGAEEGRSFAGFAEEAKALLAGYDWPGNVRQLQNVVRRVVVMNDACEVGADILAMALVHGGHRQAEPARTVLQRPDGAVEPFWVQERRIIERALSLFGGNVGRAAAALRISPSTIYRKKQAWSSSGDRAA